MGIGKEIEETSEIIKRVLSIFKYKLIMLVTSVIVFSFLYYFLVAKIADNDVWISVMMSGAGFVTFSIVSGVITALFTGILVSLTWFKFKEYNKLEGKGFIGLVGSGITAFGTGCPTCGAFLFGLIGMPLILMYFPFRGLELQVVGIVVLITSIWFTSKSVKGTCKIN